MTDHRQIAADANGEAWDSLSAESLDSAGIELLLDRAHAASYHWTKASEPGAVQRVRAAWMLARAHTVAGNEELALRYAHRCAELTSACADAADFDQAYAHEALARAHALAGDAAVVAEHRSRAEAIEIDDEQDRAIVESDLAAGPWFDLE